MSAVAPVDQALSPLLPTSRKATTAPLRVRATATAAAAAYWQSAAANPVSIAEGEGVTVNGKLYVIGGHIIVGQMWEGIAQTDVYNPGANQWTRLADAPQRISEAAVAAVGSCIYMAGGYITHSNGQQTFATCDVFSYDTATNVWSTVAALPQARGAGALVAIGNVLHYVGGSDINRVDRTDHWILDLGSVNPRWQPATQLPAARNRFGATVLDGKIYAVGGQTGFDNGAICKRDVYVFDPLHPLNWTLAASLPFNESHIGASTFTLNGAIIVIGGDNSVGRFLASVTQYNPVTNSWTSLAPLPQARFAAVADAIGNQMIVTTGYNGVMKNTTWVCAV